MRGATVRLAGRQDSAQSTATLHKSTHFRTFPFKFYPRTNTCKTPLQQLDAFSSYRHVCFYFSVVSASREAGRSRPVGLKSLHKPKLDPPDKDILDPLGSLTVFCFCAFEF